MYTDDFQKMLFGMVVGVTVALVAKIAYTAGKAVGANEHSTNTTTTYYVPYGEYGEVQQ